MCSIPSCCDFQHPVSSVWGASHFWSAWRTINQSLRPSLRRILKYPFFSAPRHPRSPKCDRISCFLLTRTWHLIGTCADMWMKGCVCVCLICLYFKISEGREFQLNFLCILSSQNICYKSHQVDHFVSENGRESQCRFSSRWLLLCFTPKAADK